MSYIYDPSFIPQILSDSSFFSSSVPAVVKKWTFNIDTNLAGSAVDTLDLTTAFVNDQNLTIEYDGVGNPGVTEDITLASQAIHVYPAPGLYTVTITETAGGFVKFLSFNNGGDKLKIKNMSSIDALEITEPAAFWGCTNLNISATNVSKISSLDLTNMHRSNSSLTKAPFYDLSLVQIINGMYWFASLLPQLPLYNFNSVLSGTNFLRSTTFISMPVFSLPVATNLTGFIRSNSDIESLPNLSFPNCTAFNHFANGCTSLSIGGIGFTRADSMTTASSMWNVVTLPTLDWSNLLVGIEANNVETGVTLSGGNSLHNAAGTTAIAALVARAPSWVITDGGAA